MTKAAPPWTSYWSRISIPAVGVPRDQVEQTALAVKLDHHFSKNDILRMYLDTVYFGHGFYGITNAAQGCFGVPRPS